MSNSVSYADVFWMGNKVNDFGNMRLSVMQESDESVRGKPSEDLSTDEIIMDNVINDKYLEDNDTLAREEGSMISNLPLLFANGYPTSLEKITMVRTLLNVLSFDFSHVALNSFIKKHNINF